MAIVNLRILILVTNGSIALIKVTIPCFAWPGRFFNLSGTTKMKKYNNVIWPCKTKAEYFSYKSK